MQIEEFRDEAQGFVIRAVEIDGEEWFVAKDVCDILEIGDARRATEKLDDDERSLTPVIDAMNRTQEMWVINESGLYTLILRSRKPKAKEFRRWVTHEVLPAIRRHGSYALGERETALVAMEHPVTTFLEVFDELARRGVAGPKAAYSIGCLFQSAVANAISSQRPILPLRYPPPVACLPAPREERAGGRGGTVKRGTAPLYRAEQVVEIARRQPHWAIRELADTVMRETGMSKSAFWRFSAELHKDGQLVRDQYNRVSAVPEGGQP